MDTSARTPRILTFQDAFVFKQRYIDTWKPVSEVWALKHGDLVLSTLTAFGSIFITYMFRKELKLRAYAKVTCYFPVVGVSAIACHIFQELSVSSDIIRSKGCPLCTITKAGLVQATFGMVYPIMSASMVCFYMADALLTYPVPPLSKAPREVFHLLQKIVRKNQRPFLVIGAIHMIAASFITFQKQRNFAQLDVVNKRKKFVQKI